MQRTFFLLVLGVLVIGGILMGVGAFGKVFIQQKIGNIEPALAPAVAMAAPTAGKKADERLKLPEGFQATLFATEAPGARDLQFSPDGTLLVSLRTQGQVIALPDKDGDGVADRKVVVLEKLRNPHGLAFRNGKLFVAEEKQVNRYVWDEAALTATFEKKIADLPAGGAGHVTRSLLFDNDGRLFISVGSTCNVCNEKDQRNGTVLTTNEEGENVRVFASGLRNAVFLTLDDSTNEVWVSENSRDLLGDDVPPDEINILTEGANYGWPFCYGRQQVDSSFGGKDAAFCATTQLPVAELQAHSAALGLTFVDSRQFAGDWQGDLLVAFHGSWNRSTPTGYKVVRLRVDGKNIVDQSDFMTGFLQGNQAMGRPVDLEFDQNGSLYLSDDKAGVVYLITRTSL